MAIYKKSARFLRAFSSNLAPFRTLPPMNIRYLCLVFLFVATSRLAATELYNLDFTPPEVGSYQVVFGNPTVQSSVGPFTDALVFHAVSTYDQIRLPINSDALQYNIQYDVFGHNLVNSNYIFHMTLDTPEVRSVSLHGGQNRIEVFQPFVLANLGPFANDQVYHFEIRVDLVANLWSVLVDGTQRFSHTYDASDLQSIRFTMSPAVGGTGDAPGTYAALDNVVVTDVPEPGPFALFVIGLVLCGQRAIRGYQDREERR